VVAVSLYTMMDKLMLGAMSTNAQMGFYEASERIILCASSVITAFGTVMMPRMTKLFSDGDLRESQRYMKLSVDAIMAIAFAIALGIVSVSRLFAPIFWGEDFAPCAYILSALALSIPFSGFANVIRMQYLIPNGMDGAYILSVILGAVSNLTANSLLIPRCGALGAAVGTVIAEGVVCAAQCLGRSSDVWGCPGARPTGRDHSLLAPAGNCRGRERLLHPVCALSVPYQKRTPDDCTSKTRRCSSE